MSPLILVVIGLIASRQTTMPRLMLGVFLLVPYGLFTFTCQFLGDISYYVVAALCDVAIVYMTGIIRPITYTAMLVQRASTVAVVFNTLGLVLWWNYYDPLAYNVLMGAVHGFIILAYWLGGRNGSANSTVHNIDGPFSLSNRWGYITMSNHTETL